MDTHLQEMQVISVPTPARWVIFCDELEESIMKTFKNILIALLALLLILALGLGYLMLSGHLANPFEQQKQATVSAEQIEEQLEKCSDLTTAKLTYKGIVHFTEGQIKYITKNEFNMQYTAKAVAGIDMSQVTVDVQEPADGNAGKVVITIPKATLQDLSIDEDSLAFYDEKTALFNKVNHEDVQDALVAAKEDAKKNMGKKALIAEAQSQAEDVIRGFVAPVVPDGYELEIN